MVPIDFARKTLFALALAAGLALALPAADAQDRLMLPERVSFASLDGTTALTGYLFRPAETSEHPMPAVVMMHGRAGAYSTRASGTYDATTLSQRHLAWGRLWASHGFTALLVDGFGPRGYAGGFPIHSYASRPAAVDEVDVRPGDAYAALAYLAARGDVDAGRVALQGWSNGGSATLAAMNPEIAAKFPQKLAFRLGVALYPACGLHDRFAAGYATYAPLRIYIGTADEEVSHKRCIRLAESTGTGAADVAITVFEGATHGFDDPGIRRQRLRANRHAKAAATREIVAFVLSRI